MEKRVQRGDLFYADLNPVIGSEQGGIRPVLVIQNDTGNLHSPTVIAALVSSKGDIKPKLPTHYYLKAGTILPKDSVVLLEQIRTIDKSRLKEFLGNVGLFWMEEIDNTLAVSVGLKTP